MIDPRDLEAQLGRALLHAEQRTALLDRVRPPRRDGGVDALERALATGSAWTPELAEPVDQRGLAAELMALAGAAEALSAAGARFATRARELALEAELVSCIGGREFERLATRRFDPGPELRAANALAEAWIAEAPEPEGETIRSDDRTQADSLFGRVEAELALGGWSARIEVVAGLLSVAAAGEGVIKLRAATPLSRRAARRLALHEVRAHVAPREAARARGDWLGRVGVGGAGEVEEGRGIWLERRARLCDADRRRELAYRHRACVALRGGAEPVDVARDLVACGASHRAAARVVVRATRGGGLCREIVYLPAYLRVERAIAETPDIEPVLARGRFDLETARAIAAGRDVELA